MQLTAVEVRILGSLVEKESTTPDVYPLSLNALTNACNQTSNRDPVMALGEDAIRWAINNLRQQSLVRAVQGSGSRVMKYQHLLTERMNLDGQALAVLCVLMLRGPQTVGEIRGRTGRLAELASPADIEAILHDLVGRELAVELQRRPGQKEVRYTHLLSGPPATPSNDEAVAPEGDVGSVSGTTAVPPAMSDDRIAALETTIEDLRRELQALEQEFADFKRQFT